MHVAEKRAVGLSRASVIVNDLKLSYRIGGAGPPLLLIHGFTMTGHEWDSFIDDFGKDYTVIVPDMPGHGESERLPRNFSFRHTAKMMFNLLDELGFDRVKGIGHSGGANTLLRMAVQQPERMEAMVLVTGAHRLSDEGREGMRTIHQADIRTELQQFYQKHHPGGAPQIEFILTQFRTLADNYDDYSYSLEELATVSARTLLVWGDRDPFYPLEIGVELYNAIADAAIWVVPGQEHAPIWDWYGGSKEAASIFTATCHRFFNVVGQQ